MKGRSGSAVYSQVGGTILIALFVASSAGAQARRFERHFTVQGKPVITVQNATGRIQVKAWDKQEVLIAGEKASTSVAVDTEQVGNRIEVATRVISSNANPDALRADYDISVPVESELQVRSDSGNVTVDSVHGDMSFDTVAADLALQDVEGYLVVKSIGGSTVCLRCAGRFDATSISGNFQLLQPTMDNVRVQTSSGNILFDGGFMNRGIYVLKNYSGTIEVRFSSSDSFDVRATSLYGNVINQAPVVPDRHNMPAPRSSLAKSLFGTMNDGRAKVELSSFNGTIKISKRE
jgi:Putative adhesin